MIGGRCDGSFVWEQPRNHDRFLGLAAVTIIVVNYGFVGPPPILKSDRLRVDIQTDILMDTYVKKDTIRILHA